MDAQSALAQDQRSLKSGDLKPLTELIELLGLQNSFSGNATISGADPIIKSPHHLGDATAFALLLEAVAAASLWNQTTGESTDLSVELTEALHSLHSTHFLWQSGYAMSVGAETVPTNGLFKCADGRYIMIESGPPYVKLERGYLNFFDCGNNRESIGKAISTFQSDDLQEKLSELGLPASIAYSPEEWQQHPQGIALSGAPVIEIEKIADGDPLPLSSTDGFPLSSVKVIDLTHVLAGPRSMRSLAQYGADVLHISSPYHRDTVAQNLLVNIGKRSAYLHLKEGGDLDRLQALLEEADVFSLSYRPKVAQRFGLEPATIAQNHRGIVCVSINAYGYSGPWKDRPGFDQNGQVATGFAITEAKDGVPKFSPVFYLNDFLTGYLAAAGTMAALHRRATEGGSYHVKMSLARTAMWVQSLGLLDKVDYSDCFEHDHYEASLRTFQTTCGRVTELSPAVNVGSLPRKDLTLLHPFGADPAEF